MSPIGFQAVEQPDGLLQVVVSSRLDITVVPFISQAEMTPDCGLNQITSSLPSPFTSSMPMTRHWLAQPFDAGQIQLKGAETLPTVV
jgi:hypothetical protein